MEDVTKVKKGKCGLIAGIVIAVLLIAAIAYYVYIALQYSDCFLPGTVINGIAAEGRTVADVESELASECSDFCMTVKSRGREDQTITSSDVNLRYVTGEAVEEIYNSQKKFEWLLKKFKPDEFRISTTAVVDDDKFYDFASGLKCFDRESATVPVKCHISDFDEETGYQVVPSTTGNILSDKDTAISELKNAFLTLESEFNMDNNNGHLYDIPYIEEDLSSLQSLCDKANKLTGTCITYTGSDKVLDGNVISRMITFTADDVVLNESLISAYVRVLSDTYDTYGKDHVFKSTWGDDVTVEDGTFGWLIDQDAEYQHIIDDISSANVLEREPDFKKRGISFGKYDYGDTYVEVNLTAQHMYYYKEGKLIVHSNVVTGKDTADRRTPQGVYSVFAKQTDRILRGELQPDGTYEYESHVNYWMPFNKGIGLHDATWRGSFGGNIWKYSGSHGCVNLPLKTAKTLYNNIEVGCPVICYFLEGTSGEAPNAPEVWVEPETVPETTKARVTTAETTVAPTTAAVTTETTTPIVTETVIESAPAETEAETSVTHVEYGPGGMTPPAEE